MSTENEEKESLQGKVFRICDRDDPFDKDANATLSILVKRNDLENLKSNIIYKDVVVTLK